jgi:cell division protein FtsN
MYFVQVGAYASADDAEQQRAKLALAGLSAKISEREQSGRTVYRVRLGPYSSKDEADSAQQRLTEQNIDARLVRVERN